MSRLTQVGLQILPLTPCDIDCSVAKSNLLVSAKQFNSCVFNFVYTSQVFCRTYIPPKPLEVITHNPIVSLLFAGFPSSPFILSLLAKLSNVFLFYTICFECTKICDKYLIYVFYCIFCYSFMCWFL